MDTRAQLQMKYGDTVQVNCQNCGKIEKKHLNKISAIVDNRLVVAGFILGLLIVAVLFGYMGIMMEHSLAFWKVLAISGTTISGIPIFFWNRENKAVSNFNRYAIRKR